MPEPCPFCSPAPDRIAFERPLVFALWDAFPVSEGHLLVVPRRHVATWFDASAEEHEAIRQALDEARQLIAGRHGPDGYNIGVNVGRAAGQTVFHLHVHLIPRYSGDVQDPRGGVRHVIPGKGNYLADAKQGIGAVAEAPPARQSGARPALVAPTALRAAATPPPEADAPRLVYGGEEDPLLPYLGEALAQAAAADVAVGFVMPSGLDHLDRHLKDFQAKGGRLRLLTGDYLGVTEPDALVRLLDLEGDRHLRVFETTPGKHPEHPGPAAPPVFHPKAYLFERRDGSGVAFVGSSNLSASALTAGIEWNYRAVDSGDTEAFRKIRRAFEDLWSHPATRPLTREWIDAYRKRRPERPDLRQKAEIEPEPRDVPKPHAVQREALEALESTRAEGNTAGLVVLATGLGKTWLAAFDTARPEYRRILFVAHREEILEQSRDTFRRIRPDARLGFYRGGEHDTEADVLFASIQTLGRNTHLERFARDAFDYVVVDEFHHADAKTYRRLIAYFRPKFLLGLTATPERTDGGDLLALCEENLVYTCNLLDGVKRDLLCRFQYFGVPDEVDYANIPWRNARFDEDELTKHVATQSRAKSAYEQLQKRGGQHPRALAFCVSKRHADFMADFFRQHGLRAAAVHSGPTSAPRAQSLDQLSAGHLDVLCAVDVFNEGLDLPEINAFTGGLGTGGTPYFTYEKGVFRTAFATPDPDRTALQELTRELVDWRLADYLSRNTPSGGSEATYTCKVSHANGRPILFLDRAKNPGLPEGTTPVEIDGVLHDADFVKIALNVVRKPGTTENRLPDILRTWFGPDAGRPGTRHQVAFENKTGTWQLRPLGRASGSLQLWHSYMREEIPPLFGFDFSEAVWNQGFVTRPGHIFLLVTLDKSGKGSDFQYKDHFLSPTVFQWESQTRTRRDDTHGRLISTHKAQGIPVHLFIRKTGKVNGGKAAPFIYGGDVEFQRWEGDRPITVQWRLPAAVPGGLWPSVGRTDVSSESRQR